MRVEEHRYITLAPERMMKVLEVSSSSIGASDWRWVFSSFSLCRPVQSHVSKKRSATAEGPCVARARRTSAIAARRSTRWRSRRLKCVRRGSPPRFAPTKRKDWRGCSTCARSARAACWPTTWVSARRCRPSRIWWSRSSGPARPAQPHRHADEPRRQLAARDREVRSHARGVRAPRAEASSTVRLGSSARDVVLTTLSGAAARRGVARRRRSSTMLVLDEAQAIKNRAQPGHARARSLQARAPALPDRHADREQPRRAVVDVRVLDARASSAAPSSSGAAIVRSIPKKRDDDACGAARAGRARSCCGA